MRALQNDLVRRLAEAGGPDLNAFVDGVIAEAEAQSALLRHAARAAIAGREPASRRRRFRQRAERADAVKPEAASAPTEAAGEGTCRRARRTPVAMEEEAPSLVPPIEHEPLPGAEAAESDSDDIESYAARRQRLQSRRKQSRRSSRWTAVVLVLFAVNVALIGARNEVVRYLPQTASLFAAIGLPVNFRNLEFENVRISKELQDGVNILIVEGTIVSTAGKPVAVPRLRFAARNAAGQEVYIWTALPTPQHPRPRRALEFRSRLASPPADARNVMVRFFNAPDAAAGAK